MVALIAPFVLLSMEFICATVAVPLVTFATTVVEVSIPAPPSVASIAVAVPVMVVIFVASI